MAQLLLGLGSNLGDRAAHLEAALRAIHAQIGLCVNCSSFYETMPWGFDSPHPFLNAVAEVETQLSPLEVLHLTQHIEQTLGRTHKSINHRYHDRTIDLDLLAYDQLVMYTPELTLPHPHLHQRDFVLHPLQEVAPHWYHPLLHRTASQLWDAYNSQPQ